MGTSTGRVVGASMASVSSRLRRRGQTGHVLLERHRRPDSPTTDISTSHTDMSTHDRTGVETHAKEMKQLTMLAQLQPTTTRGRGGGGGCPSVTHSVIYTQDTVLLYLGRQRSAMLVC